MAGNINRYSQKSKASSIYYLKIDTDINGCWYKYYFQIIFNNRAPLKTRMFYRFSGIKQQALAYCLLEDGL